jgi:hypothetical protein
MRRLRQSVHPAISDKATARPNVIGFNPSPTARYFLRPLRRIFTQLNAEVNEVRLTRGL